MNIVHELEVREGELLFNQLCEFVKNRLGPVTYKHNELINVPSYTSTWYLSVITHKLCFNMLRLSLKILFHPYLTVQMWIVNKRNSFIGSLLNHLRSNLFFTNTKKAVFFGVVPKDSDTGHLLVESLHIGHLGLMLFF